MAAADDVVELNLDQENICKVNLHGATLTSWLCDGTEMLFVSQQAVFNNVKAIRGGIPIVYPHFGPWELGPQHGFARISRWTLEKPPAKDGDTVSATFLLQDNENTRQMWQDNRFNLFYTVIIGKRQLKLKLDVRNEGNDSFEFTTLLHTYFKTLDVNKVTISGLKSLKYIDKVRQSKKFVEENDLVTVKEFVDRLYIGSVDRNEVTNLNGNQNVVMTRVNLPDVVVWNPWQEKAKVMSDFGDEEYKEMICVEAGYVAKPRSLSAGARFEASVVLDVI
ncbi:putative glucose-6-phosphate 1-epimerase [Trichoplax sp. H2]|uniref:glucose-6-phosphate 1-epimerase n=1 Tax=Trichoplax adhaerens TaxID=10228 RepID=B3RSA1_TRIAD|nr:hypothetical protein TRIADDRAFT_54524 [Trichoplax adhaerens]EDV27019.1 hypothetical protein TRIADDRAFT_54524 [Trichoplax adhaerens]RDD46394.1 putative glucose-6-phosphate 1-epimerase [Trichoplax sp. H2]|eukprot:XP_002111015.1 hypothetical protein TRIADDRAFT_54524 [Trichoplax adhaerens]